MPPAKKILKEQIVEAALQIVREDGLDGINARTLAKKLGCSVQPVFSNFSTMQEVRIAAIEAAWDCYRQYMEEGCRKAELPYKGIGMAYIRFAKEEPRLFRLLFMNQCDAGLQEYLKGDPLTNQYVAHYGGEATGLAGKDMDAFHRNMFIYTHGIATLIATQTCSFTREQVSDMLTDMFRSQALLQETKQADVSAHKNERLYEAADSKIKASDSINETAGSKNEADIQMHEKKGDLK